MGGGPRLQWGKLEEVGWGGRSVGREVCGGHNRRGPRGVQFECLAGAAHHSWVVHKVVFQAEVGPFFLVPPGRDEAVAHWLLQWGGGFRRFHQGDPREGLCEGASRGLETTVCARRGARCWGRKTGAGGGGEEGGLITPGVGGQRGGHDGKGGAAPEGGAPRRVSAKRGAGCSDGGVLPSDSISGLDPPGE